MRFKFSEAVAAVAFLIAESALTWAAIVMRDPAALGALTALTAAGAGFFMRGKVQQAD